MAGNAEDFVLRLVNQVSGPAQAATTALAQLEARIQAERTALSGLEGQLGTAAAKLRELGAGTDGSVNIAAFRKQQEAVAKLQSQIDNTSAGIQKLEGSRGLAKQADAAKAAADAAKGAGINYGELGESLGKLGGPAGAAGAKLGQVAQGFQKLAALGPAGIVAAVTVAVVALTVALAAGAVALTKWAVGMADTARNAKLANESLAASHEALANIATILPSVQASTGLATDKLQALASKLAAAGVKAKDMQGALQALATATAGGASVEFIAKLEAGLKATGKVPAELAEQMAKFEAIAKKKLLSLDAQSATLKRNVGGLFAGLRIDPLLGGLSKLVGLFDSSTASGKALAFLVEKLFQPLIDGAAAAVPVVERVFLTLVLWSLKAYVALARFANSPIGAATIQGLKVLGVVVAVVAAAVAAGIALMLAPMYILAAVVGAVVVAVGAGLGQLASLFGRAWSFVTSLSWSGIGDAIMSAIDAALAWLAAAPAKFTQMGLDMVMGLASGIASAAGAVLSAITGVVSGAIGAARGLLDSHSPSRVFAQLGVSTGEGFTEGVDDSAGEAQGAMRSMVAPPPAPPSPAPAGASAGGKGGLYVDLRGAVFGDGVDETKIRNWMDLWWMSVQLGLSPTPEGAK